MNKGPFEGTPGRGIKKKRKNKTFRVTDKNYTERERV